jgi:acyl dehydratase
MMSRRAVERGCTGTPVSAGYDRIRFTLPVFAGDALTTLYNVEEVGEDRTRSRFQVLNQDGKLCVAGTHILRWI